jgi:glycosyltransferase involved in cell wall biosynthesis
MGIIKAKTNGPSGLVSVIITCYNQARFLGQAIDSVLAQSYRPVQIIVVDDGSSDDTPHLISNYPGVHYIRQENLGVAAARNAGLRQSKGEYLVFLDGDDRLLPDALMIGVNALKAHPSCAFVYGHCNVIAADGTPLPSARQPPVESDHYPLLLQDNFIWMPAMVMYRRATFQSLEGFSESADHSCDYEMYLRITRNYPVHCHDKVVAEWRRHGHNTSYDAATMLRSTMFSFRQQWKYVKGNGLYEDAYRKGLEKWLSYYGDPLTKDVWQHFLQMARESKYALKGVLVLIRHCPRRFVAASFRKVCRHLFTPQGPEGFSLHRTNDGR